MTTTREKIEALVATGEDFTADQAAEYTGRSKTMCKLIITELLHAGALNCREERVGLAGRVNVYSKGRAPIGADLGGLRGMMITKAWKPGELRL